MKRLFLFSFFVILSILPCVAQSNQISWGKFEYKGKPWVENVSKPNRISEGLNGRHISVWASHGRYYDSQKQIWKWQRPNLFCTTEDLFTQSIVIPYLMPMLENAGAVVISPRERDWQKHEIIVDNDSGKPYYFEVNEKHKWEGSTELGFAAHGGNYFDGENPFIAGTIRQIKTTRRKNKLSYAFYQPFIPADGKYAVYVSYRTLKHSVDDAEYIVCHKGQETKIKVNQKMGGGTWVYLGTFDFDKGNNIYNRVIISNHSKRNGIVTTDAVRIGGGMGNILRGGTTSGVPKALEGARYFTQWAGAPRNIVSKSNGANDYNDDINSRSLYINWLAGGSDYVPNKYGLRVPIELSLAIHSDAGVKKDGTTVGTLGICTTKSGNPRLGTGLSRNASKIFAEQLVANIKTDIEKTFYKAWNIRNVIDQNYSETRLPEVPSAILETMSHQNFNDMRMGQDPNFKFTLARSIYKTILRYTSQLHGTHYTVQPLTPNNFKIEFTSKNKVKLSWKAVSDITEPSAKPTSYNVYIATGTSGFDNGTNIKKNSYKLKLEPGVLYHFRITACNQGGESFPTEVLSAYNAGNEKQTILIINGFHRLSSPAIIDTETEQGFDMDSDPGISYGPTMGWCGKQSNFDKSQLGKEGTDALGFSGDELAGKLLTGNNFNHITTHADAIAALNQYNIVSCSSEAVENGWIDINKYALADLALGLEKDDGHSLFYYKAIKPQMQKKLSDYLKNKGKIFINGAYFASDAYSDSERKWLARYLKIQFGGVNRNGSSSQVVGLNTNFDIYRFLNENHYGAYSPDIILPISPAFCAMKYSDNTGAAVAYKGTDYNLFAMSFPFECIKDKNQRLRIMKGIITFLMN